MNKQPSKERRKQNHQCVQCGKFDERTLQGKTLCNDCDNKRKDRIEQYKKKGICVCCGTNDAVKGQTLCLVCRTRDRKRDWKNKENYQEILKKNRDRYKQKKDEGICVKCSRPVYKGIFCYEHYLYRIRKNNEDSVTRYNHYKEQGLCIKCGGGRVEGRMVCQDCLEKLRKQAEKNFSPYRKQNSNNWKKYY